MDISGSYTLKAPRDRVWENLLDPDMLQKTIPGCEKLEQIGPDEWRMRVNVGIAAVKGVYEGTLRMSDQVAPEQYRMVADGTGARSVLHGEGTLSLEAPDPNTTVVNYKGEAQINGPLAGIANRVAGSVSRMMVNQFFGRFQREMDAKGASAPVAVDATAVDATAVDASIPIPSADGATPTAATAAATHQEETMDDSVFDASTSGVWEMPLPEARPLDGEQGPATALPLDPAPAAAPAAASAAASLASAPPAAVPAATPDATPAAPAASSAPAEAPAASAPPAAAEAPAETAAPVASAAPAASAAPPAETAAPVATAPASAAPVASAAPAKTPAAASGGFMAWVRRLFGGNS